MSNANFEREIAFIESMIEPLIQACIRGSAEDVHEILKNAEREVDVVSLVNHVNTDGFTPITATLFLGSQMSFVSYEQQENVLKELENFGADFDAPDGNGWYPLYLSLCADFPVTMFVLNRCNPFQKLPGNINFMMFAANMGSNDVLNIVSNEFQNKNEKDNEGNTAIHHAVLRNLQVPTRNIQNEAAEVAGFLCALGVDPLVENNNSQTAFDLAIEKHMYDVALELRHCEFPDENMRRIGIQIQPGQIQEFIVYHDDTVFSVKQAIFFDNYRDFDFLYPNFRRANGKPTPNSMKVMDDMRTMGDYNIKNGDLLIVQPKIRSGVRGGKRKTQRRRR